MLTFCYIIAKRLPTVVVSVRLSVACLPSVLNPGKMEVIAHLLSVCFLLGLSRPNNSEALTLVSVDQRLMSCSLSQPALVRRSTRLLPWLLLIYRFFDMLSWLPKDLVHPSSPSFSIVAWTDPFPLSSGSSSRCFLPRTLLPAGSDCDSQPSLSNAAVRTPSCGGSATLQNDAAQWKKMDTGSKQGIFSFYLPVH